MSTVTGGQGNIVTNGLIFNIDAANPRSYQPPPFNTNTWNDLSGNNINGTLTNGPTYNSANNGSIVCDGTNDSINFGSFGYYPGTTGNITLEMWIYPTGPYTSYSSPPITNLGGFFGESYFNATNGWGLGMSTQSSINYWIFQVRNGGTVVSTPTTVSFTNNVWYHVVGTFTRNDLSRLYINGVLSASVSSTPLNGISITPSTANDAKIGVGGGAQNFYAGCRMGAARIYNRALSATEVTQNFNTTRARFGL